MRGWAHATPDPPHKSRMPDGTALHLHARGDDDGVDDVGASPRVVGAEDPVLVQVPETRT
jgi:hypothetical protein